jgi:hypothetical protein
MMKWVESGNLNLGNSLDVGKSLEEKRELGGYELFGM